MDNSRIEAAYPITFRKDDSQNLGGHLALRHSVELIGIKRVGISNFLRFFLYHKDIVATYINHGENHLFIPVDLNDLVEVEIFPMWILTFKRLVDVSESPTLSSKSKAEISTLFLNSIQSQDLFLTIENLRKALLLIVNNNIFPTIFFLRFDRLKDTVNNQFFANLQGLVEATNGKLSYVFTSFRSLDEIAPSVFPRKLLSVFSHPIYLKPAKIDDMRIIFETFEKKYNVNPSSKLLSKIVELSGGHVQYLHLCLIILNQFKDSDISGEKLTRTLIDDERITLQSEEIWESLIETEQKVLYKIAGNGKISREEKNEARYLTKTGFINDKNEIFSPFFEEFLRSQKAISKAPQSIDFTKKENLLFTILHNNLNTICDREKIIEFVWPESEDWGVSDWTIDRLVARLRTKLKNQKSKYSVETVKTRGYKLIET